MTGHISKSSWNRNVTKEMANFVLKVLKDCNIIVYLRTMFLSYTFGNPNNIAAFLLFQLQVRVENTEMKLLHESVDVKFNLKNH